MSEHHRRKRWHIYGRALAMLAKAAPGTSALLSAMLVLQGLTPPAQVWLFQQVIDAAVQQQLGRSGLLIGGWAAIMALSYLCAQWIMLAQASLNERFTAHVELLIMHKANSLPDLSAFESSAFYDTLQNLTRLAPYRPLNLLTTTVGLVPALIASAGLVLLLGAQAWWLPLLLVLAALPLGVANLRLQQRSWNTIVGQGPLVKALRYVLSLATTSANAKEVRLLQLGPLLEQRYRATFAALQQASQRERRSSARMPLSATLGFVAVSCLAFAWVLRQAEGGQISPGGMIVVLQGLLSLQQQLGSGAAMAALLHGHLLFFAQLFEFSDYRSALPLPAPAQAIAPTLTQALSFRNVSYTYANGTSALADVSFSLRAGECLAIVGENGAGKSTLVKLVCRLYDPSSGAITVDGHDLRTLDLAAWRRCIAAVFQDFGRYDFTVAENIALGRADSTVAQAELEQAASAAGFAPHVARLRSGYATQLGPQFDGVELSGGQWQTLGIARALIRDAQLLILDEPTAALDPRAEVELFQRFRQLAQGRTTLLITHRLASVRMADRILVLKAGRLVEHGTHAELLARDGEYAALYRLQAQQYTLSDQHQEPLSSSSLT